MTVTHISTVLKKVIVESCTVDDLRHVVAAMAARDHIPSRLAKELADELGAILSAPDMETELGPIPNGATIGWHRRRLQRIAAEKASS